MNWELSVESYGILHISFASNNFIITGEVFYAVSANFYIIFKFLQSYFLTRACKSFIA